MANPFDQFDQFEPPISPRKPAGGIDVDAIARGARELGIDPEDLVTAISYETGGTFDPDQWGPTTKWGRHRGLIQFGEPQRAQYGVRPGMTIAEQMPAVVAYLRDAGVRPGMGMLDVYSAINAGGVGRYNASDAAAGGAPGTVADKVNRQMGDHRRRAQQLLGGGGGGGGGGGAPNPFGQFDSLPPAPDFGNVQSGVATTETGPAPKTQPQGGYRPGTLIGRSFNSLFGAIAPDSVIRAIDSYEGFDPTTPTGIAQAPASEAGDFSDMALRSVMRVPQLAGQLIDLVPNAGDATIRALGGDPDRSMALALMRAGLGGISDAAQEPMRAADAAGFGRPSVTADQTLDALDPRTDAGLLDRLKTVGTFIPETLVGSSGDMAAAVAAPYAFLGARTNEIAENRAANDQRPAVSLADLAIAAPAAGVETLLERLTTGRLLPGGAAYAPGPGSAVGRVARETALQGASGGVEELAPYLAETVGTEKGATGREALATLVAGVLSEGALGGGVQSASEIARAAQRAAADIPARAPEAQAEVAGAGAVPRQGEAPAAPPLVVPPAPATAPASRTEPSVSAQVLSQGPAVQQQELAAPAAGATRPDLDSATRAIDNRLAALDETAAGRLDEAEVSQLAAERQELDDLLREQDRAKREGIVQPLDARLSPEERATAENRRQEIAATLERHRAARTAADQAQRLRSRLESADTDAALYDVAREIDPTLGTLQAQSFRAGQQASAPGSPAADQQRETPAAAPAPVQQAAPAAPIVPPRATAGPASTPGPQPSGLQGSTAPETAAQPRADAQRAPVASAVPAARAPATPEAPVPAPEVAPATPEGPRAEAQRQPAAEPVPGQTGIKNAITDAERVAEGRDPIIREARKANRETVDEAVNALRETPTLGRETAARVAAGGPLELKDEAVLLVHKVDLRKRRDAAAERAQSPTLDEEARTAARREYEDLVQQIDEVDQAAVRIGTESGRLLQLRRRMIAEDYSLPALERKLRMVVNRELKPGEVTELREMAEKVAELQRKLDAAESQQASAQVAEMLARLMKQAPGRNATLAERRAAAAESRAALSAMAAGRGGQRSVQSDRGEPGQARAALDDRFGRGVIRALERDGVLKFEGPAGGSWDGATIRIGDVQPENAVGVLLHEASHARLAEVLGEKAYETALRDLDALEAAGDAIALKAARRAARSGETGARLDDERLAYLVEEAANANRATGGVSGKVRELARRLLSAFRQWAATSPVYRALERIGAPRPRLQPEDFVGFAEASLRRLMRDAAQPEARRLRGKIGQLETELRTDRLTGMRNRRAFDEDEALGWPAVVAIDMDGLKRLNDAIGHEAADNVMRALADELRGAESDDARFYRRSGDEFAARFRDPADAEAVMQDLQTALEGMQVQLDVADADGRVRSYTYEGIGISYGTGDSYETADAAANRQKQTRLEAGLREPPRADGPSRRLREVAPRPGGRRAGDPPAVGAQRSIPVDVARGLAVQTSIPADPLFQEAVANTNGATVTRDGLEIDLIRFQKEEQSGDTAIRTGVFYLPAGSANIKYYKGGKSGYGGTEKIEGRTLLKRPLFVKGGTGGKAPEAAYDLLFGKGAYQKMRDAALRVISYGRQQDIGKIEDFLESYGADSGLAYEIVQASKTGNQLPYALQENVVAHAVRNAGYDAVVGHSKGKAGAFISEIFDVREDMNPTPGGDYSIHEKFRPQRSVPEGGREYPLAPPGTRYEETNISPVMMTPDEFLSQVAPLDIDDASRDNIDDLKEHILAGRMLDPLHIRRDGKEDGRHRAVAARELGIELVPVIDERPSARPMRSIPEGEPDAGSPVPAGADPVAFFHLARMGAFHYADGARDVAEWTRRMESDLGAAAGQYRSMLPDAFKAAQAQATRPSRGQESVAEAVEAIGDQRRPRDVKRVVRAVVAEGMRGEDQVFEAAAQALDMDTEAVRALFVQPEPGPRTLSEAQAEINRLRKELRREQNRPKKEAREALRRNQREMREAQREAMRLDPETQYQNQRARGFQRRIAELEARIAAGDFAKRERVERELTKQNERLRFELEKAKERFHQYALEAEFAQRTPLGKLWGETVAGINFSRAIMTSLDLSAVFRQGGFIAFGNPGRASKAIPQMFKSLVSEKSDTLARMDIMDRPNAPLYKRAGLQLTGIGGDALSRVEETYASRWVDKLSPWAGGGLIRGSGRAYTAFLNRLRADSFDAMVAALARDGSNPTKEEIKAVANYINVATGRGDILGYQPGEVLTATFFAPRLVASRFQLLAGQPLYGGSNRTRKMIAQEYARFLLGVSVAITLAAMMRDEDDETKIIEVDPRSSDFGKVRFGNTFIDPLAGLAQVTVFLSRVATGETRRGADADTSEAMADAGVPMMDRDLGLRPLRDEYRLTDVAPGLGDGQPLGKVRYGGTDVLRVGTNFIRSKLAPVPGFAINAVTRKDFKGDPITLPEAAGQLVVPMSVGSLVDVLEANGMARGTAIYLLGILGFSVQYRKPDAEELAEDQNGVFGAMGFGTAEDME